MRISVFLESDQQFQSPLLGRFQISENELEFRSRFPLRADVEYVVRIPRNQGHREFPVRLTGQTDEVESPRVEQIFPTAKQLPQNLLRIFVQFSQPMRRGEAYTHLKLMDSQGHEIERPFLELPQELWDPDQRRFALLFDPGRIKRDLAPRIELGPPLEVGRSYTLIVEKTWRSAAGQMLSESFVKQFEVTEPWDQKLETAGWSVSTPNRMGSLNAVTIQFDRALNRAMLENSIQITFGGQRVVGKVSVEDQETLWRFVPDQPWARGQYQILIDNDLEDIAGNTIRKAFEVDLSKTTPNPEDSAKVGEVETPRDHSSQTQFSFEIGESQ